LEGRNKHITFHKEGGFHFHVNTPKEDESNTESLSSFFPEDRYISLLEVLATVHRHSQFLDAFQHWQVKYTKKRPPERVFPVPSRLAEAIHSPSGLNATLSTMPVWP
jgi:hypothetical protein